MSFWSGLEKMLIGGAEIGLGVALPGIGTAISAALIASGAGLAMTGIGSMIQGTTKLPANATAVRDPIHPWDVVYGETRQAATCVYMQTWGNNDEVLDMVFVLASHPCQAVDEILFDQQRIQIDTSAIPTSAKAGYSISTPAANSGTSFTPVQQTVNISTITRSSEGVVTIVLPQDIPYLTAGDQITVQNVSGDASLTGVFQVSEIISRVPSGGTNILTFTVLNGGVAESFSSQGQVKTRWADYGRTVYVEPMLGTQTLGETFVGMTAGTPWMGTGKLVTPASPLNAGGTATPNPWTNYCSLVGMTAVFVRIYGSTQYYPGGLPNISFHLQGKNNIYDPRIGSTSDPSAYGYTTNAALCIADYLSNSTFGYSAAYGTQINTAQLEAAANVCDTTVPLAIGGTEPMYTCNGRFDLSQRRGDVLSSLLSSCGGKLVTSEGQYYVYPATWYGPGTLPTVDLQAIASGSPRWKPTCSISELYNGAKGTYVSPDNLWKNTDIPYYAQDSRHGYSGPSMYGGDINLAADGGQRRWLDLKLPFTISPSMAQRLLKIELLRRRHYGTGTFKCNMNAYQYVPMDIVSASHSILNWSGKTLEITGSRLVIANQNKDTMLFGVELDVQETDSSIYAWSTSEELSPQAVQQSQWPQATAVETEPYAWSPGYVAPLSGDAFETQLASASFGVQPLYGQDASGNGTINLQIKGTAPINVLDTEIESPQIFVASSDTGGSLTEGDYVVALSARNAGSSPYLVTSYQDFGHINIGSVTTGSITVTINWGSGDDGGDLFLGYWTANGYIFHHNQTISSSSTTTATITTFDQTTAGGPDPIFDHFGVIWQQAVHTGPWAEQVQAVTSTTITIDGPIPGGMVTGMTSNQWAGYTLMLLAKFDPTKEIPILNMPIASSTASDATTGNFVLTIGANTLGHTLPDLTTLLDVGDLVGVAFQGTFTANGFSDANIENAYYPSGASGTVEAGHVAVVLTGADVGDVVPISSVLTGGTSFTLANSWTITPTTGDLVIICEPANVPQVVTAPISTSSALTGIVANPNVLNLESGVWLFRVRTEDVNGNYGSDLLDPWRLVYIFGQQGTGNQSFIISS